MKGITFGNYHSYDDWGLILTSKSIKSPEPKLMQVDIEGGDGVLDLTNSFGDTRFKNRSLSFTFTAFDRTQEEFVQLYSNIHNAIHGQKMKVILDDDPEFYYVGRISVNEFKAVANIRRITVECDCDPWKYKLNITRKKVFLYGKNMFDKNNMEQGILQTTVGAKFNDLKANGTTRLRSKVLQYVKPNTRYTMTIPSGFEGAIRTFDIDERQLTFSAWWSDVYSFTTGSNVDSIAVYLKNLNGSAIRPADIADVKFQIEEGNEATEYEAFVEDNTITVSLENLRKSVVPTITTSAPCTILFEGKSFAVNAGTFKIPEIELKQGMNEFAVRGLSTVIFSYREGGI